MDINMNGQDISNFWEQMQKMVDSQTVYSPMMVEGLQQISRKVAKEQKKVADQYEPDE